MHIFLQPTNWWQLKFCFHPLYIFELKFVYSEKATKFFEIFTLLLSYVVRVKSRVKISQNFVAFSEYMNFTMNISSTQYCCQLHRVQYVFYYGTMGSKLLYSCSWFFIGIWTIIKLIWNILWKIKHETSKMFLTHCVWPSLSQSMCQHILCYTNMLYLLLSRSVHVL